MIDADYVRMMARYNRWQNKGIITVIEAMDEGDMRRDRGAFWGSISGTLNHLLWGDMLWMSRFDGGDAPEISGQDSPDMTPNKSEWARLRFLMDGRIEEWARTLGTVDLVGDLEWHSALGDKTMKMAKQKCVVHFFNHQTHHRGQVHAMLTTLGRDPGATDIPLMPGEN